MTEMRKTGLILIALLLFLAGCSYFPDQAVHVVDMDRAPVSEAASEYPPSVESAILTDLERSLRVDPDSKLQIVTLEVGADWVSLRVSAPKGMALSLAHGGSDTAASWTASCGALATLSRKASDICADYGRDSDAVETGDSRHGAQKRPEIRVRLADHRCDITVDQCSCEHGSLHVRKDRQNDADQDNDHMDAVILEHIAHDSFK